MFFKHCIIIIIEICVLDVLDTEKAIESAARIMGMTGCLLHFANCISNISVAYQLSLRKVSLIFVQSHNKNGNFFFSLVRPLMQNADKNITVRHSRVGVVGKS